MNVMRTILKLFCLFISVFFITHLCNKKTLPETELFLSNVEALANDENVDVSCFGRGSIDCPVGHQKVYRVW